MIVFTVQVFSKEYIPLKSAPLAKPRKASWSHDKELIPKGRHQSPFFMFKMGTFITNSILILEG